MSDASQNDWMSAYWLPFTPNKAFKAAPRLYQSAHGKYYKTADGRDVLDAFSGLWCCNLGHNHPKIVEAIREQAGKLDYASSFNFAHTAAFELANDLAAQFPGDLNHVFYVNSGSEAADTALKMAIAYHRLKGEGTRTRLVGRVHGYHGVGFGGISVGGMVNNRKFFGSLLPGTDHLRFPYEMAEHGFTRGMIDRDVDAYMAELEGIIQLHDPSTIAAVMVEPFAGSGGVFVPPRNYLARLREVTARHGILLIVDEVISAFGRMGATNACSLLEVEPDIVTVAKGINNGAVPLGAAIVQKHIYETFMDKTEFGVEFFHGYTYSGHPLAVAAAQATQDIFRAEGIIDQATALAPYFEERLHGLRAAPNVIDIRNVGLAAGITIAQQEGTPGKRSGAVFQHVFEQGVAVRANGDHLTIAPILTFSRDDVDRTIDSVMLALRSVS
ncbi:MAG: aminotransferase class III-fold pyridoxal phosphate-dependent enzyme [Pseudomonadota bacterium]